MNLGDLKTMLAVGVNRSDCETLYEGWINRALRKIQQDLDLRAGRSKVTADIPAGETSVILPADFKCLTSERYPVYLAADTAGGPYPCDVVSREHAINLQASAWPSAINRTNARYGTFVFLDIEDDFTGLTSLNVVQPASQDLSFTVSCYKFLAPLEEDAEENVLTTEYEDLVESKVKAVAFSAINDPLAGSFEQLYRMRLTEAAIDDSRRLRQGRPLRMGGF